VSIISKQLSSEVAYSLPDRWAWKTIEEIAYTTSGGTPSRSNLAYFDGSIPWVKSGELEDNYIEATEEHISEIGLKESSAKLFPQGTVLVALYGATIGKTGILKVEATTNQAICGLTPKNNSFIPEYLAQWIRYQRPNLVAQSSGGAQPNINQGIIRRFLVPLPPLNEQHRIVARLESILAQTKTARAALERVPELLKAFRQSVLAAAFRGELTERDPNDEPASVLLERIRAGRRRRWEETLRAKGKDPARVVYEEPLAPDTSKLPELPEGWVWTTLDLLLERIEAGHSFKAQGRPAQEGELGVIKVSAMTWGKFLPEENKALFPDTDPGITPRVCKGDLLISRANTVELVGAVVLVEEDYPCLFLSDKSLRLVPITEEVSKEFLLYALRTRQVRDEFEGEATGVSESMRNISQDKIRIAPIALPPLHEQAMIIQKIKHANALSGSIALAIETGTCRLVELEQSALTKAFRGEL